MISPSIFLRIQLVLSLVLICPGLIQNFSDNLVGLALLRGSVDGMKPRILEVAAQSPSKARMIGRLYLQAEKHDLAKDWLQLAITGTQAALAYSDLCLIYWSEGNMHNAMIACKAGNVPGQYWVKHGAYAEIDGNIQEAVWAYQMAVKLTPNWPKARMGLARLLERQKQYNEIIQLLEPLLGKYMDVPPGYFVQVGAAYWKVGQNDQALRVLSEGHQRFPDAVDIYRLLAYVYQDQGELDLAGYWYDRYLKFNPDDIYTLVQRAQIAELQTEWWLAISLYQRAAVLSPDSVDIWLGFGRAREALGQRISAIAAYKQALRIDPLIQFASERLVTVRR